MIIVEFIHTSHAKLILLLLLVQNEIEMKLHGVVIQINFTELKSEINASQKMEKKYW